MEPIEIFEGSGSFIDTVPGDPTKERLFDARTSLRLVQDDVLHTFRIVNLGRYTERFWANPFSAHPLAEVFRGNLPHRPPPPLSAGDAEDGRPNTSTTGGVTREAVPVAAGHVLGPSMLESDSPWELTDFQLIEGVRALQVFAWAQLLNRPQAEAPDLQHPAAGDDPRPLWWMSGDSYSRQVYQDTTRSIGWKTPAGWDSCDNGAHAHTRRLQALAAMGDPAGLFAIANRWRIAAFCANTTSFTTQPRGYGHMVSLAGAMALLKPTQEFTDTYCGGVHPLDLIEWCLTLWERTPNWWDAIFANQWKTNADTGAYWRVKETRDIEPEIDGKWKGENGRVAHEYILSFHLGLLIEGFVHAAECLEHVRDPRAQGLRERLHAAAMSVCAKCFDLGITKVVDSRSLLAHIASPYFRPTAEAQRIVDEGNKLRQFGRDMGKSPPNDLVLVEADNGAATWVEKWRDSDTRIFAGAYARLAKLDESLGAKDEQRHEELGSWCENYQRDDARDYVDDAPWERWLEERASP